MAAIQKRVLIVDDEEDLTWTLSKVLSKDNDKFELICVNSGREAIEVLNQLPVDLVITDVRMPEVSGLELLVRIKELYPRTKVIIMTAYGSSDVQKEATERGCFHYIEKPFEIHEIRQLILDALTEKKGFHGRVADFQLSDIIQLNCLGRLTSALLVRHEDEEGWIYFQDGNIIHAETRDLEGESAFHYMMSWQGGEFSVIRNKPAPKETITQGWQSLLLESLRRADEQSELVVVEREREKRHRMRKVRGLLEKLLKSEGIEQVMLHTGAGFPISYVGPLEEEPEHITELGNQLSNFLEGVIEKGKFLGEAPRYIDYFLEDAALVMQLVPGKDAWISILGKQTMNIGFIRIELRKILPELQKLI